ncbi:MAG: cyclic nucleotide-binding domain-containing protein, partial [Deltaproteobacteria bacterium]|nr:cyclic nucleotide-binding domain-containing protein [Deltaproteobacteria bacterium]
MAQREAPYIPQMEAVECGAACLTMVLAAHGHHAPLSEVRAACGVSRDGVTLKKIVEAARSYGLSTKAQRLEPAELAGVVTPAILHWEMNHFVVLRRWTPAVVHLLDPAVGPREIPPEEFDRSFTGICVSLAPTPEFRKRAPQRTSLGRYLRTLGATWGALSLVLSASLLLNVMGLAVPLSTKLVVDHVLERGQTAWLEIIVLAALGAVAAQALVGVTRAAVLTALKRHLDIAMTLGFVRHLLSLPLPFLAQRSIGDLMNRVQSNKMLRDLLAGQAVAGLVDGLLLVSYLGLMLWLDAPLGAIVAGAGAAYCVLYAITRPGQLALLQERQVKDVKEQDQLIQIVRGMMTVKSAGSEVAAHTRWLNALVRALNARIRESRAQDGVGVALFAIRALVPVIVLALGAHRVMRGELTLGTLLGFQVLQLGFLAPLETVIQTLMRLQVMPVLMQRMDDILAAEPEPTGGAPCPRIEGRVTFEDVSFRYGLQSPLVLDGISFSIDKGQKIGLVGASGSGKSTIAKLLLGMFRPVSGRITVDGQDLASLDLASLRRQCGMVLQEAALFEGSVRENISLYHPNAPIEDVVAAARLAQIHDDIESLPKGYETRISASSGLFSGGQRQRLALARAVLHRPPIMILDEATSALDAVTESAIERYLSTRECTRIVIAHRLNTVRDADVILVLRDGRVAERGRYDELVEQGGFFAELVARGGATAQGPSRTGPPRVEAADLSPMRGLEGMTPDERAALADALQRTRHAAGDTIVTQGDRPAGLFLIEEGAVDVTIDEPGLPPFTVARLGPGDLFGELGLLGSAPNSASVVAVEATRVLHLPQEEFQELRRRGDLLAVRLTLVLGRLVASRLREAGARLGEADGTEDQPALAPDALPPPAGSDLADGAPRARRRRARELALAQTPFGASLSDDERAFLEFVGTLEHPGEGEVLFREGDAGDEVFLLLGGRVGVERAGVRGYLRVIKPGDLFGELALFDDAPRSATCV